VTDTGGLRVLLHKPLTRTGAPYFRVRQYVDALERLGHDVDLLDFGRLRGGLARKAWGVGSQFLASARAFRRHDVIIMTPHPLMLPYVFLARALGRRVILDQILTYISHAEIWRWFPRGLDAWVYRGAHGVLTHSETMRRELVSGFAVDPGRVEVAYPVLDLRLFAPRYEAEAARLRHALGLDGAFIVMYHGMWHPWHGVPYLFEAARLLEDRREIVFVIIPRVGDPPGANIRFLDEQPFDRLPLYLQMADVWCSGFDTDARGERAFSSTLIQALALGRPIITGRAGERGVILHDGEHARLVPIREGRAIAEAIRALAANPEEARAMGARARRFAEDHFSIERLDRALAALLGR
jgi:glycosyltransferase involved in cell wall biosynthesis